MGATARPADPRVDVREEARKARREMILAAAEQLLVDSGVERMRLRDVALSAGISIGTVQYYFDTRAGLISALFDWSARRRLAAWVSLEPGDADPWQRVVTLLDHALDDPLLRRSRIWIEFLAMARDEELRAHLAAFYDTWRRPFREAIEAGLAGGELRPVMPVEDLVDALIAGVDGAEVATVLEAPGTSRERLLAIQVAVARALLGPDGSSGSGAGAS